MAEKLSRRDVLSTIGALSGSMLLGGSPSTTDRESSEYTANANSGDAMPEELKNIEFWRAADTSDYKSIEIDNYPAIIIVESGPYEGMRLHTQGSA